MLSHAWTQSKDFAGKIIVLSDDASYSHLNQFAVAGLSRNSSVNATLNDCGQFCRESSRQGFIMLL